MLLMKQSTKEKKLFRDAQRVRENHKQRSLKSVTSKENDMKYVNG